MECMEHAFDLPLVEQTSVPLLEVKLYGPERNDVGSFISMECMEKAFGSLAIDLAGTVHLSAKPLDDGDDNELNKGPFKGFFFLS